MLKKYVIAVIIIALFYFGIEYVNAYEYMYSENERGVLDLINEIYDVKEQYEDLAGGYEDSIDIYDATDTQYWWPIGSEETTVYGDALLAIGIPETTGITSNFGNRDNPFQAGNAQFHSGLDISGGRGEGQVNVIAARSGIVVYPDANVSNDCPSSRSPSNCGGGYGNYVIIQHNDGNYTLYAHMYEGSITVKAGDAVEQGQVIGKMGSSGNSTGPHLHFEVRIGSNAYSSVVDPLGYINPSNPRPTVGVVNGDSNKQTACLTFKNSGYNDEAVIAIMQNLFNESGINPINLQNEYEKSLGYTDESYTSAVDNGIYNNFVHDSAGYGLAQWTFYSRKQDLLDYTRRQNASIGDIAMQLSFFEKELSETFPDVQNYLKNVSYSYESKTEYFCLKYENPKNASTVCSNRAKDAVQFATYVKNGCEG